MFSDDKGFTLAEVMVAIMILMVGLLALLQATNFAMSHNLNNQLRTEAIAYGDEIMARELAKPFALISTAYHCQPQNGCIQESAQRQIGYGFVTYNVNRVNSSVTTNTTSVQVTVSWTYKGVNYSHSLSSLASM